jgi:hypothetical protein
MAASHPQEISAGASRPTSPRHLAHKKHPRVSTTVGPARGPACQRRLVGHIASPKLVPWQRHKDKATTGPPPYFSARASEEAFPGTEKQAAQPSPAPVRCRWRWVSAVLCLAFVHGALPGRTERVPITARQIGAQARNSDQTSLTSNERSPFICICGPIETDATIETDAK